MIIAIVTVTNLDQDEKYQEKIKQRDILEVRGFVSEQNTIEIKDYNLFSNNFGKKTKFILISTKLHVILKSLGWLQ